VATFAPPGQTQTVLGPNDLGAASSAVAGSADHGRLGPWVLALPAAFLGGIALFGVCFAGSRALKRRARVRAIEQQLARTR
jgi:hypothetical protein